MLTFQLRDIHISMSHSPSCILCIMLAEAQERLLEVYERLEALDVSTAEMRAAEILHGLGFTSAAMNEKSKNFSGGWRMRIALARALYIRPSMMLLDEPTNHLDLDACVWLEQYLKRYDVQLWLVHTTDADETKLSCLVELVGGD